MAIQSDNLRFARVAQGETLTAVLAEAEVVYDNGRVRIGDGSTPGGIPQARLDDLANLVNRSEIPAVAEEIKGEVMATIDPAIASVVARETAETKATVAANTSAIGSLGERTEEVEGRRYVVERSGTADGRWLWTIWSDGWIEQIYWYDSGSNQRGPTAVVSLPYEMEYSTYNVFLCPRRDGAGNCCGNIGIEQMTTTGFKASFYGNSSSDLARHLHITTTGWMKEKPNA